MKAYASLSWIGHAVANGLSKCSSFQQPKAAGEKEKEGRSFQPTGRSEPLDTCRSSVFSINTSMTRRCLWQTVCSNSERKLEPMTNLSLAPSLISPKFRLPAPVRGSSAAV